MASNTDPTPSHLRPTEPGHTLSPTGLLSSGDIAAAQVNHLRRESVQQLIQDYAAAEDQHQADGDGEARALAYTRAEAEHRARLAVTHVSLEAEARPTFIGDITEFLALKRAGSLTPEELAAIDDLEAATRGTPSVPDRRPRLPGDLSR